MLGETGDILSTNMYAYCVNNPVMNVDPEGRLLLEILVIVAALVWAAQDIYDIASGNVYFKETDNGDGGQIVNSYKVQNPYVVLGYSIYLRYFSEHKNCFDGSAAGIAAEWIAHNIAFDATYFPSRFGLLEKENESSRHLDLGRTVFNEKRWYVRGFSGIIEYFINPICLIYDYYQYLNQNRGADNA
jgi:hypothetical protein